MFPSIFTGDLLRLASPQPEDQTVFNVWTNDDDYMRMLDDDPVRPQSIANFASFGGEIRPDDYYFHLRTLAEDQVIGFVVLHTIKWRNRSALLAIGIGDKAFRGRGYGQDALKLILNYAFSELCLHRVSLTVMDYNTPAIRAYERAGFVREGAQRQAVQRNGQYYDLLMYGILDDEWQNRISRLPSSSTQP